MEKLDQSKVGELEVARHWSDQMESWARSGPAEILAELEVERELEFELETGLNGELGHWRAFGSGRRKNRRRKEFILLFGRDPHSLDTSRAEGLRWNWEWRLQTADCSAQCVLAIVLPAAEKPHLAALFSPAPLRPSESVCEWPHSQVQTVCVRHSVFAAARPTKANWSTKCFS